MIRDSFAVAQFLHNNIRHKRTGRALLSFLIHGERACLSAYSKRQYERGCELIAALWSL